MKGLPPLMRSVLSFFPTGTWVLYHVWMESARLSEQIAERLVSPQQISSNRNCPAKLRWTVTEIHSPMSGVGVGRP
jgi:hypothetical protein